MKKPTKGSHARKRARKADRGDGRPEYDFRGGTRGKYAVRYAERTNLILLDPELAAEFPDSRSVSRALKAYLKTRPKIRTA